MQNRAKSLPLLTLYKLETCGMENDVSVYTYWQYVYNSNFDITPLRAESISRAH
jgi:hypothetical protein